MAQFGDLTDEMGYLLNGLHFKKRILQELFSYAAHKKVLNLKDKVLCVTWCRLFVLKAPQSTCTVKEMIILLSSIWHSLAIWPVKWSSFKRIFYWLFSCTAYKKNLNLGRHFWRVIELCCITELSKIGKIYANTSLIVCLLTVGTFWQTVP